jgi:spermidine/putrescine transport system substrate-binding protein
MCWLSLATALGTCAAQAGDELVFLTWADYIDPQVVAEFEQAEAAQVRFVYFASDFNRNEILVQTGGRGFDLASIDGGSIGVIASRGWLAPVDESRMPNLVHLDPRQRTAYPRAKRYGVPYTWGTLGIAYRADLVPRPIASWTQLFQPEPELHGKIVMIQDPRELIGMALKALGYSSNSEILGELAQAETLLLQQRPLVQSYSYVTLNEDSALVTGKAVAAMVYNGDALMLRQHQPAIRFIVPEEGGGIWVDYISVLSTSPRKALATRFIDFLNRPEVAARNAQFLYYATPNLAAERLLPPEFRANPVIYPTSEVMKRSEHYMTRLSPEAVKARQIIYSRLVP